MNIEDIAHKIATFAMEQKDNVGMYTAIRFKVIELLEEREKELEIAVTELTATIAKFDDPNDKTWEPSSGMAAIALAPIGSEPDDNGWLPIDTYNLPDGTPVLVWDGEWQSVADCISGHSGRSWWIANSYGVNEDGQIYSVTHWQPLPKTT